AIVVQFFCPDAVCTGNLDLSANETFLLKSIELPQNYNSSSYDLTIKWTDFTNDQPATIKGDDYSPDFLIEAVSVDYYVARDDNLLEEMYAGNGSINESLIPTRSVRKWYSTPILVRYEKAAPKKPVNIGLIVLCVFLFVLFCGMLLAVLARKHASQSLTNRYKRKPVIQDESSLMSSLRFDRQNNRFEEEYK
uniref:Uncharacterized protein n=1 Tax=Romanomermis culicivorax TaxID=13658 RepID=A0A915L1R9_ROMCU